jgi:hypothetical protein
MVTMTSLFALKKVPSDISAMAVINCVSLSRMRVAICNILLQRVQASVPIERSVQTALNAKLFSTGANPPGTPRNPQQ